MLHLHPVIEPYSHLLSTPRDQIPQQLARMSEALTAALAQPDNTEAWDAAGRAREEVRANPDAMRLLRHWGISERQLTMDLDHVAAWLRLTA